METAIALVVALYVLTHAGIPGLDYTVEPIW